MQRLRRRVSRFRARTIDLARPRPIIVTSGGVKKKKKKKEEGESSEEFENDTRSTTLRNVTRHRRHPSRRRRRRRRFISRVSFRRYCHSRPIKNACSHGRGVLPNVLIKEHAMKIREAEKGSINL